MTQALRFLRAYLVWILLPGVLLLGLYLVTRLAESRFGAGDNTPFQYAFF